MQQIFGQLAALHGPPPQPQEALDIATDRLVLGAPIVYRQDELVIALKGRPRIAPAPFDGSSIAGSALSLYLQKGPGGLLGRLRGPFALVIVDTASNTVLAAIDRMGIERLCWARNKEGFFFGSSAARVARAVSRTPDLNRQVLFDFMLNHMVAAPDTVFSGVGKLLRGEFIRLDGDRLLVEKYWHPSFARPARAAVAKLQDEVLPTLRSAVAKCGVDSETGAFLSGGLDSSTVLGIAAESSPEARAFSVGFGVEQYDELAYARIASQRFKCVHYEYEVTPKDVVDLVPRIAAFYDEPFGNSSAVPTFCCARLAKDHGIGHLLAGDGGDELFGGNERYVRQRIFELYQRVPRWLRRSVLEPLAARLNPEVGFLPLRKFSSYVRQGRIPLPDRFESWNLIYREGPANVFSSDFLASIDPDHALRRMREVWESCPSQDFLDRMLWYDWKFTLADNDLRKVSSMCDMADVRVSYPMLDENVVELSIKVPSDAKISGSDLRTFYKKAVRSFLPEQTIAKQKHGFGLPFGVWLKTEGALQDLVYDSLHSLKGRGFVRPSFIDRVLDEHRRGDASYYGYAMWDLLMLEQWLRHHATS